MIVFDLCCAAGDHRFEAWFASSDSFVDQQARRLLGTRLRALKEAFWAPFADLAKSNLAELDSTSSSLTHRRKQHQG